MKPKILVADDSQTIQKVIKITLANEEYELIECLEEKDLNEQVKNLKPTLVLLDFNLSENKTGYDLAKEIKSIHAAKIMMLYGTFDTIEENLLEESGVNSHIVKPFDGAKFINYCRQMVDDSELDQEGTDELEEDEYVEEIEEIEEVEELKDFEDFSDDSIETVDAVSEAEPLELEEEEWVVNQPEVISSDEDEFVDEDKTNPVAVTVEEMNQLEAGMQDWGIDVPPIMGLADTKDAGVVELPPIMGEVDIPGEIEENIEEEVEVEAISSEETEENDENILPSGEDLEYPDMDAMMSSTEDEAAPTSELQSIENLAPEQEESNDFEVEETGPKEISLDATSGTSTDEEVRKIEEQIADEIDKDEDIWSADEFVVDNSAVKDDTEEEVETESEPELDNVQPISAKMEDLEEKEDISDLDKKWEPTEEFNSEFDTGDLVDAQEFNEPETISTAATASISAEEIEAKLESMIGPMIEKIVQEKISQTIDKVAWEVIPDLAENLIKKELKTISEDILNSTK